MKWWISIIVLLLRLSAFAQIDKEFYFAVPFISPLHADRPVYLHFTSFDAPATVTVKYAGSGQVLYTASLNAFSSERLDVSDYIDIVSATHGQVTNYGLLISSSSDITAYYEVYGSSNWAPGVNSEIFVLKGKKALGLEFYIPVQTHWNNHRLSDAWNSFDIIATENNTTVTIYPTKDLLNHPAGTPFTVVLQKGQVYSARSLSYLGSEQPSGSKVVADKPIAITLKHDSILEDINYDLAGDQLIPVDYLGTEYVAIKASGAEDYDHVFIVATEDNTEIFISGNATPVATLNESESFSHQLDQEAQYIHASQPICVFHVAGYGKELAGALLPPIVCTGSKDVSFTRANTERFSLGLLVRNGGEDDFILNNKTTLITASAFQAVPGLPGWKFALIDFNMLDVEANESSRLLNTTSDFQMAFLNGQEDFTGFRYGIFSDYGGVELGNDVYVCPGETPTLNAGYGKDSYAWSPGGETTQTIAAEDSGLYKVTVTKGTCSYKDSLYVGWYETPELPAVGADIMVCTGAVPITLSALNTYNSYLWNTGGRQPDLTVSDSGTYILEVKNMEGCMAKDSIHLGFWPLPQISITPALTGEAFCKEAQVNLSVTPGYDEYLWYNGMTTPDVTVPHTPDDVYKVKVTSVEGCTDSTSWQTDCSVYIGFIPNLLTINGDTLNDVFWVEDLSFSKWSLEVYDRWGSRVYFNSAYQNNWSPRNIPPDLYFYRLYHNVYEELEYKGWVQVVH